jgi:hydrogenase expression/formation protein HypD
MKYLDEFRDPKLAWSLIERIRRFADRRWVLMDVCGGQTHSLVRHGIESSLAETVELIHGPGCPVCVTPIDVIDFAVALATTADTIVASFGDMLRVPGSRASLLDARRQGGQVKIVYSPVDAVKIAKQNPSQRVVFLAVGFETTAPSTALALLQAAQQQLTNFSIIPAHVRVLPAMEHLMQSADNRIQGFLAAGHVCTVTGYESYESFTDLYRCPVVVTGFEPIDLLEGIFECLSCLQDNTPRVVNRYGRSVCRTGNVAAQELIRQVYQVADRRWRGFGVIPDGGLALQSRWAAYDAYQVFPQLVTNGGDDHGACRGADVMAGRLKPRACPEFGTRCTPESPLGAPMVSSEGACAAYFQFEPVALEIKSR